MKPYPVAGKDKADLVRMIRMLEEANNRKSGDIEELERKLADAQRLIDSITPPIPLTAQQIVDQMFHGSIWTEEELRKKPQHPHPMNTLMAETEKLIEKVVEPFKQPPATPQL